MTSLHPLLHLTGIFVGWKALLLSIALGAPGVGYDTSTTLLLGTNKLVRWDAIYYVQTAHRGLIFEQEWAFGKGLSTILSTLSPNDVGSIATAGILLAHVSHYISMIILWQIARLISNHEESKAMVKVLPFIACCLHIVAPAGIFLSAPYSESPFSALNMLGTWVYLESRSEETHRSLVSRCCLLVSAGLSCGAATAIRSNGVLSGLPFLLDAISISYQVLSGQRGKSLSTQLTLLVSTGIAGLLVAAGLIIPQSIAYYEYCSGSAKQPWCQQSLPLIYSYVQSHYWGVGFLRYWTLSNLPLFLLALPILTLLLYSSVTSVDLTSYWSGPSAHRKMLISQLAIPSMVLASLAITNYHVQVISRLASGYPWLYIWLAKRVHEGWDYSAASVRFFILYAMIQAVLFASFLPPA